MADDGFRDVALGIVVRDGRILLVERDWDVNEFPGMVAFPGGDIRDTETPLQGAVRLVEHETNIRVDTERKLGTVLQRIQFPSGEYEDYRLHVYEMRVVDLQPVAEHAFWQDTHRLDALEIVPSDLTIFEELYEKREDYDVYDKPTFVSAIVKDRRGDYVHTEFERLEDDQGA